MGPDIYTNVIGQLENDTTDLAN